MPAFMADGRSNSEPLTRTKSGTQKRVAPFITVARMKTGVPLRSCRRVTEPDT